MFKKLKWLITTRQCDICQKRKPLNQMNFFSMYHAEQICEGCLDEQSDKDTKEGLKRANH